MEEFSTKQGFLFYSFPMHEEEKDKIDGFLSLLDCFGIAGLMREKAKNGQGGRPTYNPIQAVCSHIAWLCIGLIEPKGDGIFLLQRSAFHIYP